VLRHRLEHVDAELDRVRGDHCLGDRALVVRGVLLHEHMFA
jgi:hypothetical protein